MIPIPEGSAAAIAHTIQLSVAPVFLLAGLGQLLNLFAGRLARVIDRSRWFDERIEKMQTAERRRAIQELRVLDRRIRIVSLSITLCTISAVSVSLVVAGLFMAQIVGGGIVRPVAFLFIFAMASLIASLIMFLIEIQLANRSIRVRNELLERE